MALATVKSSVAINKRFFCDVTLGDGRSRTTLREVDTPGRLIGGLRSYPRPV
jgi:hypothetical protein